MLTAKQIAETISDGSGVMGYLIGKRDVVESTLKAVENAGAI